MLRKFVMTQFKNIQKKDWAQSIKNDLKTLEIDLSLQDIELMPKSKYRQLIQRKIKYHAFQFLVDKKDRRNGKGREIHYQELEMQNYLKSDNMDINNNERKLIFQLRTRMSFKIKSHFRNMCEDSICDGCRKEESNTRHILECEKLFGQNELVTYIPLYEDLFGNQEEEQVYIARIIEENLRRLPV
jgi:hypothetical protein